MSEPVVSFPPVTAKTPTPNPYLKLKKPPVQSEAASADTAVVSPQADKRPRSPPSQVRPRSSEDTKKSSKSNQIKRESPPSVKHGKIPQNFDADRSDDEDFEPEDDSDVDRGKRSKRSRTIESDSESEEAEETSDSSEAEEVDEVDEEEEAREVKIMKKKQRTPAEPRVTQKHKRDTMSEEELKTRPTGWAKTCTSWSELEDKLTQARLSLAFEGKMCGQVKAVTTDDTRGAKPLYESYADNVAVYLAEMKKIIPWATKHGSDISAVIGK